MKTFTLLQFLLIFLCGWIPTAAEEMPYSLNLEVGKTYYLEVRFETQDMELSSKIPSTYIDRAVYRLEVLDQPTDSTFSIQMKILNTLNARKYYNRNYSPHFDTRYHLESKKNSKSDDLIDWNMKQTFCFLINPKGRVIKNEGICDNKNFKASFRSPDIRNNLFWFYGLPIKLADESGYEYKGAPGCYLYEVNDVVKEEKNEQTTIRLNKTDRLTFNTPTSWIKHGYFQFDPDRLQRTTVMLSGWTEDHKAIVTGNIKNSALPAAEVEQIMRDELSFELLSKTTFDMDDKGNFQMELVLDHPVYAPVNITGKEEDQLTLYLRQGDRLHLQLDANDLKGNVRFSGNCVSEQLYLLQFQQASTWESVDITAFSSFPTEVLLNTLNIESMNLPPNKHLANINQWLNNDLAFLEQHKEQLDPFFYASEYWSRHYKAAQQLLKYHNLIEKKYTLPDDFLALLDSLPVLNDLTAHSNDYHLFLNWDYLIYKASSLRNFHRLKIPFNEHYTLIKYLYGGYPLFQTLYRHLKNGICVDMHSPKKIKPLLDDFQSICTDTTLVNDLLARFEKLDQLEPGNSIPYFEGIDHNGKVINSNALKGKKYLLYVFNQDDLDFSWYDYNTLTLENPGLTVVHLCNISREEWQKRLKKNGKSQENQLFIFAKDPTAGRDIHNTFNLLPQQYFKGRYDRHYLVDENQEIFDYVNPRLSNKSTSEYNLFLQERITALMEHKEPAKKESQPWWPLALLNLLLGGALIWGITRWRMHYIRKQEERRRQLLEMELKSLRAQLNPHFVFNTMSSIQHMIVSQQPDRASLYLSELASLMRLVLRHTQQGVITLEEELEAIRQYCRLEAIRKPFDLIIRIAPDVDPYNQEIPAMLLQPYVENSLKHGLSGIDENGTLEIQIGLENDQLVICIQDNGIGLQKAAEQPTNGNGIGLLMTKERLQLLYGKQANVKIRNRINGRDGVQVDIHLPVES